MVELGRRTGMHRNTLLYLESNRHSRGGNLLNIRKIAEALKISPDELIGKDAQNNPAIGLSKGVIFSNFDIGRMQLNEKYIIKINKVTHNYFRR